MSEKIRPQHLARKAIPYVRQSSPYQVIHNLESQRLQFAMEARLRSRTERTRGDLLEAARLSFDASHADKPHLWRGVHLWQDRTLGPL